MIRNNCCDLAWTSLLAVALGLGLPACDTEDNLDADAADIGESTRIVEYEVIAELTTDDGATVVFTREPVSEGSELYSVGVKMIGLADGIPYGQYIMAQELSPLEVFLAFAPTGAEPPPELYVSHATAVAASGRASDEVRELLLPRLISTQGNHSYCDSYTNFTTGVGDTWDSYVFRDQVTGNSTGAHSVGRNDWNAGYGMACNVDDLNGDTKNVVMCRRVNGDALFSCESVALDDGEYGWKSWSPVASGGMTYTPFDYQLSAANVSGSTRLSYLGLVVRFILV